MEPASENTDTARVELGHEFIRYHRVIHTLRTQMADVLPAGLDPAAAQLLSWLVKQVLAWLSTQLNGTPQSGCNTAT